MAAPHLSSVIELAISAKPALKGSSDWITALLTLTAALLPPYACRKLCGSGLFDAAAMIRQGALVLTSFGRR